MATKKKAKKVSKWERKDYLNLGILTLVFIFILLCITKKGTILASTTDWPSQHSVLPDYFRTLFYRTFDLLPDFAFNLGGGQNIYNYAYYGLLNPVFMLSYLLPFLKMEFFILGVSILAILSTVLLYYKFLRNHKFSPFVSLISSFVFMGANSLIFHMHRHIMFVQYMPFLILALMGVDKYFKEKKGWLLTLGIILMILTSYYYSVVGIITLVIYGIFIYLKLNRKITVKSFLKDGFRFLVPIIIAILTTAVLLLPTFLVIVNGREGISVSIKLKEILLPGFNLSFILYKTYGLGLISIVLFALINLFFKNKENLFLGLTLSLMVICPLFVYLFNAGMYLDAKVLIPMLPLYVYGIAIFLDDLMTKKVHLKPILALSIPIIIVGSFKMEVLKYVLYFDAFITIIALILTKKYQKPLIIGLTLIILSTSFTIYSSRKDNLINYQSLLGSKYQNQQALIDQVTQKDSSLFRIANQINPTTNTNRLFSNINYYQSTIYSSTYNVLYKDFFDNVMNNPIQSRNMFILSAPKNYPFLLLMGHKYLLTKDTPYMGYSLIGEQGNLKIYENPNALPLAYASSNLASLDYFNSLGYPYNQEIILNNIVVDQKILNNPQTHLEKADLHLDAEYFAPLNYKKKNGVYIFNLDQDKNIVVPLKKPLNNELLYIHFELLESNSCKIGDTTITINDISNKLTCETWKYHNQNYAFDYVLATEEIKELNFNFSKGNYKIKNIEIYTLDYGYVNNLNDKVDAFNFDLKKTKGDNIEGDINVTNDGYFVLSVPYDKGFKVYVDNQKIDTQVVNKALLGFPINKGSHHVKITYTAPGKNLGLVLTILGLSSYIVMIIIEDKKGKKNNARRNNR